MTLPDLQGYSEAVQTRAVEELQSIPGPPCSAQRTEQLDDCSALKLMLPNYLRLRDQVRAARESQE